MKKRWYRIIPVSPFFVLLKMSCPAIDPNSMLRLTT